MSNNVLPDKENTSSITKHLSSEIINQKKQFIFKVEQTSDFVYPNEPYKYYIYLKNISGVDIKNIHIIVNNSSTISIKQTGDNPIEIGDMKDGEVKLIYLSSLCADTGVYYTHFICYGDGTGLFHKTLKINCSYNNISDEIIHRIHIYDFSPYENTYKFEADDYNNQVTQLFKIQKLPYKAGEQPFPIQIKNNEATIEPFNNIESLSFDKQFQEAQYDKPFNYNNDEHHYSYLGRENFNVNSLESFDGKNLNEIIDNINRNSKYFKATFLKTGTNQLLNDFKEYNPNGFIYRFGLLGSEIYHHVGVIPSYSYMSDYLFRWAPSQNEPLNLIPQKRAMVWDSKRWAGHEWKVYRIPTKEYMATEEWQTAFEEKRAYRWEYLESFKDLDTAESYLERRRHNDDIIEAELSLDYERYTYFIDETFYDTGVFYVNIPLNKIPTNFYLLDTEEINNIIQRSKPYGTKPLIRYEVETIFNSELEFTYYPILKPYIEIDMGDMDDITYYIESKKYKEVTEQICGQDISTIKLVPCGRAVNYGLPFNDTIHFYKEQILPRVVYTNPINETGLYENYTRYNRYKPYCVSNTNTTPDNNFNMEIEQENQVDSTIIDNDISKLSEIADILYQNNADNIGFYMSSLRPYQKPILKSTASTNNNFISDWAKNQNYTVYSYGITECTDDNELGYHIIDEEDNNQYNTFRVSIPNKNQFIEGDKEIGIGILDEFEKYHYLTMKYDVTHKKTYIKYSTSFNNQYNNKKDGIKKDINGLAISIIKIGFKHLVIFFINDNSQNLHYFHHIIISDISDVFIFASNTFNDDNEEEIGIQESFYCTLLDNNKITFELPFVEEYNTYDTYIIQDGNNWTNLYRIDKNENSYTYIQNKDNKILDVDNITLHYDNLNIPDNASIKSIKLKALVNSSSSFKMYSSCALQGNLNFEDAEGNQISLKPMNIEFYPQQADSQYILNNKLNTAQENNNDILTNKYKTLITKDILFDESININIKDYLTNEDDFISIKHCYWTEISNFTYERFNTNNIEKIEFVIEGYNDGNEIDMISQLYSENESTQKVETKIESGYFYKKVSMPFATSFTTDNLRLRYKFNNLVDEIKVFNTYINIDFKNKEEKDLIFIDTDDITVKDKKIINFDCYIDNVRAEEINNGFTVQLNFDSLSPGDFYRIYFTELDIAYEYKDTAILINNNKFKYTPYKDVYTVVSGLNEGTYLSGLFYNDVPTVIQSESNLDINNHGIELRESLYQSFIANDDNITSIEIFPNGFVGNPDNTIKISLYSNHQNTPYKLIKEVYASGWTKVNKELKDLYSIKYNFNIDNLTINEKYWIKIEVENQNPNSYYLLRYTTNKKDNFTLLLNEHNDYINTFGALEFNIYSKNLSKSFSKLPAVQDYFNNPYIMIGLHKQGQVKNLRVKKKV